MAPGVLSCMDKDQLIKIRGARTHNLKNINLDLPRNKLIVFTGLSGSGKSSLAFDTIFAEGQRRYVESLSAYARQFLRQMQKPDVDEITGLSPAISIDQKTRSGNPRSTVATITEIYDYLRVLYARIGHPYCLACGHRIEKLSLAEIVEFVKQEVGKLKNEKVGETGVLGIYAPVVRGRKGEYYQLLYDLLDKGYRTVVVNGEKKSLRDRVVLDKNKKHDIEVLIDEIPLKHFWGKTLAEAALERLIEAAERALDEANGLVKTDIAGRGRLWSAAFSCPHDGFSYPEIEPRLFSFNSPYGACPECHGLGTQSLFGNEPCSACRGARLRPEALEVRVGGRGEDRGLPAQAGKNIVEFASLSVAQAEEFVNHLKLSTKEAEIAKVVLREITNRLKFLLDVGLDYLTLDRRANTLSGGEAQRIRLASQLGSRLVGTLYVLDEPTIGLHARDNDRLIKTLLNLRDLGNTIIVVEHDEDTILSSDYLVDIGPGAGTHGGQIVVANETEKLLSGRSKSDSLTVEYLLGTKEVPYPAKRRTQSKGQIQVRGATVFNLKNIDFTVPLGKFVALTGVSGSGKSTLMYEILYQNLRARFDRRYRSNQIFNCEEFTGTESLSRLVLIDQSAIGRTPRSNPATYTGSFTFIRDLFAMTEAARLKGWGPNRFSFNVKGGRCEACQGNGLIAVEMHFLPTVYVECDVCHGRRFTKETLAVRYRGKNIDQVLQMTIEEAYQFFHDIPAIADRLGTLMAVGLSYLSLGQPATTLSGGEAQRVKIASELYRPLTERTIYLLDEPTVGLHYADVEKLLLILHRLVDRGNTVVVIEHNLDTIKNGDHIIDLGPEGGGGGGRIVAEGTPEVVAKTTGSHTAKYLKRVLKKK